MAVIYCWDSAGGTPDGTSWTDAYTDLQTALTNWSVFDTIWLASDHYESFSSADKVFAWGGDNDSPTHIYSVDRGDDSYTPATSAQFEVTSGQYEIKFDDACCLHGIYLKGVEKLVVETVSSTPIEDCTFEAGLGYANAVAMSDVLWAAEKYFKNCAFKGATAIHTLSSHVNSPGVLRFQDCIFTGRTNKCITTTSGAMFHFVGCDFSGVTEASSISSTFSTANQAHFENCIFPSGIPLLIPFTTDSTGGGAWATGCGVSGGAMNLYSLEHYYNQTSVDHTTAIYRDAGYIDGQSGIRLSHVMEPETAKVNAEYGLIGRSIEMESYADTIGSKTFRIEALHDFTAAPTKDELWIEVLYLEAGDSCKVAIAGKRLVYSSATWPTSTVAWTGDAGYSKIKLEQTVTIGRPGRYMVRLRLGKFESGKTLVYCPKVEID